MTTEPKRLRLGAGPLAGGVASLQAAVPSDERMAALAERLARAGAPVDDLPTEAAPASNRFERAASNRPRPRLVQAAKTFGPGILAVVAALGFGGGLIMTAMSVREAATPLTPPEPAPLAPPRVPPAPAATAPDAPPVAVQSPPEPTRPRAAPSGDTADSAPPASDRAGVAAPPATAPGLSAARGQQPAPAPDAPAPGREDARPSLPAARAKVPATSSGAEGAPLAANTVVESEVELLKQARSALAADPLQAYALSERCRAQYPGGAFAQEREYIAISALVRLGRDSEARSRASLFRMHYPSSAYLPRLARMLGE